ncbi:hypothetical protein ACLI4Z_09190 [Natrialbaceae archaeon A-arb3/5]|uniref:DUF7837 domain-containing protein n=1 Tax=Natronosalvus hydrolyticus TaxID=2979988 RepID=A0AAP2Z679_9EURY|nr:hypothetical protein [Halobacteria archaeon AArc-curdl1]
MSTQHTPIGSCPRCGSTISPSSLLIEYETDDGTAAFAECPDCRDVVAPE